MRKSVAIFLCCCAIGCQSDSDETAETFEQRQRQLFYEIDHKLIYLGCQALMRLHREGKLSRTIIYDDDPKTIRDELPKAIRALRATYVRVDEVMVNINFSHGADGANVLTCLSNEFGEPSPREEETKGLGFRSNPFDMDKLTGTESLEHLNKTYDHFQMELIPGLTYERYTAEQTDQLQDVRKSNEMMDSLMKSMNETIRELAVKKQKLLYQTNHDDLLKACRQVIARYNDGAYSSDQIHLFDGSPKDIEQIPEIILDLKPVYVWLEKTRVIVALIGGMDHAGVYGYSADEPTKLHDDCMKIIDGLVYYDDGLREADDDYSDYLKSLEHEAIPYMDWKRKQMNLPVPKRK